MTNNEIKLRIIPTSEGYYDALRNMYFYNYTDHLGNVRLSYSDADGNGGVTGDIVVNECSGGYCNNYIITGEIEGVTNYYPFGMLLENHNYQATNSNTYKYKYNAKELQETGLYDYGWRQYMPDIGRWNGIDQLAESYMPTSTYAYVANNPVLRFDVDGRWFNDDGTINTSGHTPSFVSGHQYLNSFLGANNSNSGGGGSTGGYTFTGNNAASLFNYFKNGGSMNGISFNNGYANWYTLDGTDSMYVGSNGMANVSSADMIMHSVPVQDPSWTVYKNFTDWGATTAGGGFKYIADQRTSYYNSGYWIDNLGTVRSTAYADRAADSQIGLRSSYVRNTAMFGKYAKRAGYLGYAISAGQIGYGVYKDGGKFGVRAQVATANVAGGMAGAAAGAWLGAKVLAPIGGAIGVAFFGVGAAPGAAIGAAIGGAIGGIVGGIVGGIYGGDYAEEVASGILNKPDY